MFTTNPPRVSLMQTTTQEQTEKGILVTLETPEQRMKSPTLTIPPNISVSDYDDDSSSVSSYGNTAEMTSDSSDWDSLSDDIDHPSVGHIGHARSMSLASSYLPRNHKKQNPTLSIDSFSTIPSLTEQARDKNNIYDNYSLHNNNNNTINNELNETETLFYPYPNLQSLLFSQYYPYTINDYKIIDNNHNINEDYSDDENMSSDHSDDDVITMDWFDMDSVTKFKQLLSQLLITASFGIREDEFYLMFSSPSPQSIIQHLRFGVLTDLCTIHIDRFGRRSFYFKHQHNASLFYNHSRLPSELDNLVINDANLVTFIEETPSPISINVDDINCTTPRIYSYSPIGHQYYLKNPINPKKYDHDTRGMSPIHNDWSPIAIARPLKLTTHNLVNKSIQLRPRFSNNSRKKNVLPNLSNHGSNSNNFPFSNINYTKTYLYTKSKTNENLNENVGIIHKIKEKHKKNMKNVQKVTIKRSRKKTPKRKPPSQPKPTVSDRVKQKLKRKRNKKKYKKNNGIVTEKEFKSISLADIINNSDYVDENNNYEIAKIVAHYFDILFKDTDTVVVCSGTNKEPDLSYWLKGHGEYVRKSTLSIGDVNKTLCIYRACGHTQAKEPIMTQQEFEKYVKDICETNKNKDVQYIGDKLDLKFGSGVHFARSTLKRCDYDIFCRFSDKYECSFKMSSGAYVIAWRR